jgi:hypothetical protein
MRDGGDGAGGVVKMTNAEWVKVRDKLAAEIEALHRVIEQQKKDGLSRKAKRLIAAEVERTELLRDRIVRARAALEGSSDVAAQEALSILTDEGV